MGKKIQLIQSCWSKGDKLSVKQPNEFRFDEEEIELGLLNIYADMKYQEVEGFGGAFTEAATMTLDNVTPELRKEILTAYFDKEKGIGYNFCRATICSSDYAEGLYDYGNVDGDFELKHFSIEHDTESIIPAIKEAQAIAPDLKIFSSPWSPPSWIFS